MKLQPNLSQLETAELVHRVDEDELAFMFKHALLQNTAYESLLRNDRRRLHLQVGESLERVYPEQLQDLAALLARHFTLAGENDRAIKYLRLAAQREIARFAYDEAAQHLESALALNDSDVSEIRLALLEESGDAYRLVRNGERAISLYQQALDLYNKLAGSPRLVIVRLHSKIIQTVTDLKWSVNLDLMQRVNQIRNASRASLEAELKLMLGAPAQPETVEALAALSIDAWRTQSPPDWDSAERFANDAVQLAEQLNSPVVLSRALDALASVYDGKSHLREHLQIAARRLSVTASPGFDNLRERIDALRGAGMAHMYVGEYRDALSFLANAQNLAENIQAIDLYAFVLGLKSQCLFRLDAWDEVIQTEEKWRDLERRYPRERVGPT